MDVPNSTTFPLGNHPLLPPTANEIPRNSPAWKQEYSRLVGELAPLARHELEPQPARSWSVRNGLDPAALPHDRTRAVGSPQVPAFLVQRLQRLRLGHDELRQAALTAVTQAGPGSARLIDADALVGRLYTAVEATAYRATAEQAVDGLRALKDEAATLQKLLSRDDKGARAGQLAALQRLFAAPAPQLAVAFGLEERLVRRVKADLELVARHGDTVVPLTGLGAGRAALALALPRLQSAIDQIEKLQGSPLAFAVLPDQAREVAGRLGLRFEWSTEGPRVRPGVLPTGLEAQVATSVKAATRDQAFRSLAFTGLVLSVNVLAAAIHPGLGIGVGLGKVGLAFGSESSASSRQASVAALAGDRAGLAAATGRQAQAGKDALVGAGLTVAFGVAGGAAEKVVQHVRGGHHLAAPVRTGLAAAEVAGKTAALSQATAPQVRR